MRVADFLFEVPDALIARYPLAERSASRLLCVDDAGVRHQRFTQVLDEIGPLDLLVFNNTRVIPARLYGHKASGGRVEILLERVTGECTALAQVRASKSPKPDTLIQLEPEGEVRVLGRQGDLFELWFAEPVLPLLQRVGHMPLPPYMERADEVLDQTRYQTVYAHHEGAVAAPTAGLHFDEPLLAALRERGVAQVFVTLHVGAGTFQPVRVEHVEDHHMHSEWIEVSPAVVEAVAACRARGGRVIAVGTTSVRALESAALSGELQPYSGETSIFLYPGRPFRVVDALITNFHLPGSSLIMLVCAFAGYRRTLAAYAEAVQAGYRFYSYGDAMFVTRNAQANLDMPGEGE